MRALDRKLVRDLLHMKGQMTAICAVIACGIATFVMSLSVLRSLESSREIYYARHRFADVFADLKRAPRPVADRLQAIPGVSRVETRVAVRVNLDVPGLDEPAAGWILSLPDRGEPALNGVYLRRGRMPEPGRPGEALASEAFAEAHGFEPGATLAAIINGKRQRLTIVGVALSPEFVYTLPPGNLFPDDRRYGIFWMPLAELAPAHDMEGAFNNVAIALARGAVEPEVIRQVDRALEPYGCLGAFGRADQLSNRFLTSEIEGLKATGMIVPGIFLGVAAFLLNVVLTRLINTQREQIATIKAFGYSNLEVGAHYLKLVTLVTLAGVALGTAMGAWLGRGLLRMYAEFYRFPFFAFDLSPQTVATGAGVGLLAAFLGVLGAVRRAARLPPAEAMRPEPPAIYRRSVVERLGLAALLTQTARMALRNLERHPVKSLLSTLGVALAVAILVVGSFMEDAIDALLEFQFHTVQREDVTVAFTEARPERALRELARLPGVHLVEPFRNVGVRLRVGPRERLSSITGLPRDARLNRPVDADERPIAAPHDGLVLSSKLAEILAVHPGDILHVEALEETRPARPIRVARLLKDYAGTSVYMDRHALDRFMGQGPRVSGAHLAVDPLRLDALYRRLKEMPLVAGVTVKEAAVRSFLDTFAKNLLTMRAFNVMFACVIAVGVVYNNARIALSERGRELATLRVIGFTRAEISAILIGELAIVTLAAIPIGLALGNALARLVILASDTELYRIPMAIFPATYGFAATVTLAAALISFAIVRGRLDRLDLVAVLKQRE